MKSARKTSFLPGVTTADSMAVARRGQRDGFAIELLIFGVGSPTEV